ncbi:glycerate kinase [Lacticaseibacillus pabuli]|uniref:Glycerate kinase n=1 Tax=Lacticaseibacillus pabuli TaxID=3025672 RepID=A0ABY7WUS4_9LACO|nr:glycerate kinase [Lacticaseibacillus sp. KACC 23028]WDF82895.1 glycerate kinase [Lacticaseibacillus sp. KACC 23028]
MQIVIMPDSFKGSLDAEQVANAIAAGLKQSLPDAQLSLMPVGDGGENTIKALSIALNLHAVPVAVHGADGGPITASFYTDVEGQTAYIQAADVLGYAQYIQPGVDSTHLSSTGVGELIAAARKRGAHAAVVALGGSATSDGGVGMLQQLEFGLPGFHESFAGAASLSEISKIVRPSGWDMTVTALADVTNPLTGSEGAAAVFGPQKNLTSFQINQIDRELTRLYPQNIAATPGAGAAGGLGAAIAGPLQGKIVSGIDYVLDAMGADQMLQTADVVITGEGHLDAQTKAGKVIAGIMARLRHLEVQPKTIALCGAIDATGVQALGLDAAFAIGPGNESLPDQMKHTTVNMTNTARSVGSLLK